MCPCPHHQKYFLPCLTQYQTWYILVNTSTFDRRRDTLTFPVSWLSLYQPFSDYAIISTPWQGVGYSIKISDRGFCFYLFVHLNSSNETSGCFWHVPIGHSSQLRMRTTKFDFWSLVRIQTLFAAKSILLRYNSDTGPKADIQTQKCLRQPFRSHGLITGGRTTTQQPAFALESLTPSLGKAV
jgi:hypothetical protein